MNSATVLLAQQLVQQASVTPDDAHCQVILRQRLEAIGFVVETLQCADVTNLWAVHGSSGPLMVFAGHTDVVPTGPTAQWTHPPFAGEIIDGYLHGRGAADMKGSIAAFVVACEDFVSAAKSYDGRIGLLITSDEEGPALHGTREVMDILKQREIAIDYCIVGEPTSSNTVADVIKVGRRGSLNGQLTIHGKQGHVAYPHLANNPIHQLAPALAELCAKQWDNGNDDFDPTSMQISNINGGTGVGNVIPGSLELLINFRFSPESTEQQLRDGVEELLQRHGVQYTMNWHLSGPPFASASGNLTTAVCQAIEEQTGDQPLRSTSGGTSDGRFIAPTGTEVVELGPINATIHQIDECINCADLDQLTLIYSRILHLLFIPS